MGRSLSEIKNLLIVEDVPETREWLAEIFRRECPRTHVRAAQNAMEFHAWVSRERPDLVLLDEVLGAGEDLASLLHVAQSEGLSVILMTGMFHDSPPYGRPLPPTVLARVQKPHWETGSGVEDFLREVEQAWALTGGVQQG